MDIYPLHDQKIKKYKDIDSVILDGVKIKKEFLGPFNKLSLSKIKNDYEYWLSNSIYYLKSIKINNDCGFYTKDYFDNQLEFRIDKMFSLTSVDKKYLDELKIIINERINTLKLIKDLNNDNEKEPIKIKGLVKPIRWEDITLIFDGDSLKIKQNNTILGKYIIEDLGIPKIGKNKINEVRKFFMSLFIEDKSKTHDILSSKDPNNQKRKSNLSKILKSVFETNLDPIHIVKYQYRPIFNTSMSGKLAINNYSSGRKLKDEDGALYDGLSEYN